MSRMMILWLLLVMSPFQLIQRDSVNMQVPLPTYPGIQSPLPDTNQAAATSNQTVAQNTTDSSLTQSQMQIRTNTIIIQADSLVREQKPLIEVTEPEEEEQSTPEALREISFGKIFWSIIIFVIGYFSIRFVTRILELFSERSTGYRITIKGLVPVVRILGWITVIFVIVTGVIQPKIEAVLALTASVGVAVGFASQDILKNIFGGIVILLDTPFKVGDKIEIGSFYGEVVEIGLRSTRIVTPDDSLVSIPNGELMNQSVSNSNAGELNCQVVAEIYLPLDIDTERIRKIATEAAQTSKYIFLNKPIAVLFFNEIKERRSYLKMRLKAYVMDIRYEFAFKSELTEIVIRELLRENIINRDDFK